MTKHLYSAIGDNTPKNREILNYLYQHHFDVYDLIGKGLAVSINDIEI